jgi:hypothetical protein
MFEATTRIIWACFAASNFERIIVRMQDGVPDQVVRALSEGVKATDVLIQRVSHVMAEKQSEIEEYARPARNLLEMVRATRMRFKNRVRSALQVIENDTEALREIYARQEWSIDELTRTAAELREATPKDSDSPVLMIIRVIAALMPFAVFSILTFSS